MTCVVGVLSGGDVWLGADSLSANSTWAARLRKDPKLFQYGDFLLGFTTSYRMGQILQYEMAWPEYSGGDIFAWCVRDFVPAARKALKAGGFVETTNGKESGGCLLLGGHGRLFAIESDFQVNEAAQGYAAIGGGADIALGALHATRHDGPEFRVISALAVADEFNIGVRGPFLIKRAGA